MLGVLGIWNEAASSGVVLLLAALGVAALLSALLVLLSRASRKSRRRKTSFSENLDFIAPRSQPPAGPSSGIDNLKPLARGRLPSRTPGRADPRP